MSKAFCNIAELASSYSKGLLVFFPNSKLIQHTCNSSPYLEVISSIRNLRTPYTVVTRDQINIILKLQCTSVLTTVRKWVSELRDFRLDRKTNSSLLTDIS